MADLRVVHVNINGRDYEARAEPRRLLSDFLREDIGLTGTHVGCEHGVCGACTVLINGESARSCLMFAVQAEGAKITTVEGLSTGPVMHPIQEAFRQNYALQCGFCTPGFLMTTYDLLQSGDELTEQDIRHGLSGNLCRCTGYQSIVEAVQSAQVKMKQK